MVTVAEFVEKIEAKRSLSALLRTWRQARDEGAAADGTVPANVPAKASLDPMALGRAGILPFVWLVRRTGDGRFTVVLVGDRVRENFGTNPVDRAFEDFLEPDHAREMTRRYQMVVDGPAAEYSEGPVFRGGSMSYYGYRLLLPLVGEDGTAYVIGAFQKEEVGYVEDKSTGPTYLAADLLYLPVDSL